MHNLGKTNLQLQDADNVSNFKFHPKLMTRIYKFPYERKVNNIQMQHLGASSSLYSNYICPERRTIQIPNKYIFSVFY